MIAESLGQAVEVYAPGNDGGQDGYFVGAWVARGREVLTGPTIYQVKFMREHGGSITASKFASEVPKVARLVQDAAVKNYVLVTNGKITGRSATRIRAMLANIGVTASLLIGKDWLTRQIRDSMRLRSLVPRVYGLGDLSQILDERSYLQTQTVLKSMSFRMDTFVVTKPYRQAVNALGDHHLVLLIGDPMTGKTTISYALALAASDAGASRVIIAQSAEDFRAHWNPNEPRQLFWVDDVFGQTSYDVSRTREWSREIPSITAALRSGARFIFTSRSYIWKSAQLDLKRVDLPLFDESSVRIVVEDLTPDERRAILYNHVRLGDQDAGFKSRLRPHLEGVVNIDPFYPEVARRLGRTFFTKTLHVSDVILKQFFREPLPFLIDVIKELDAASRGLLALMFVHGASVPLPLRLTDVDRELLQLIGATPTELAAATASLDGNLVLSSVGLEGVSHLTYAHPTVRDALASITGSRPELVDLYLAGVPTETLVDEAACAGVAVEGVKVLIPPHWYDDLARRLQVLRDDDDHDERFFDEMALDFIVRRGSDDFLRVVAARHPRLFTESRRNWRPMTDDQWYALVTRLVKVSDRWSPSERAVVEEARLRAKHLITEYLDDDASLLADARYTMLLTPAEQTYCIEEVRRIVKDDLHGALRRLSDGYDRSVEPDARFASARAYLTQVRTILEGDLAEDECGAAAGEMESIFETAERMIEEAYVEAQSEHDERRPSATDIRLGAVPPTPTLTSLRDIFADVADPN